MFKKILNPKNIEDYFDSFNKIIITFISSFIVFVYNNSSAFS